MNKIKIIKSSLVAQQINDPVLALQWLRSLLWHGFHPWPMNFHMPWVSPKKKKDQNNYMEFPRCSCHNVEILIIKAVIEARGIMITFLKSLHPLLSYHLPEIKFLMLVTFLH